MQQIRPVKVRCLVLQREQQDLLQCQQRVWHHQQGSHLVVVVVVAANQANQVNRTDHQQGVLQIMRHDHRRPVQVVLRQPRPLVISSAYRPRNLMMLQQVQARLQEDLQARVNVVALQTLRLHQQVGRARVQRMLMAVQVSVRPQCSVICLVALQQVMPKAQQLKVVRDRQQVVLRAQQVAQLR